MIKFSQDILKNKKRNFLSTRIKLSLDGWEFGGFEAHLNRLKHHDFALRLSTPFLRSTSVEDRRNTLLTHLVLEIANQAEISAASGDLCL